MAFHNVRFPTTSGKGASYGTTGGATHNTAVISLDSGGEQRIQRWENPRRRFRVTYNIKRWSVLAELQAFIIARAGAAHSFRFKDWLDFTTAADHQSTPAFDDQEIGVGDGSETIFRLLKVYSDTAATKTRYIDLPVSGTVKVAFDGVEQLVGWSVNSATGEVTFTSAPGPGVVITAGCEFDVKVRFAEEVDKSIQLSIDDFDNGSVSGSLEVIEVINETQLHSEFP